MEIKLYQIDAFIVNGQPFTGNPATVCLLDCDDDISDETKQKIAAEVNQSMTAFVSNKWTKTDSTKTINHSNNDSNNDETQVYNYKIRFFTPTKELDLCGHASVATSLILAKLIQNKKKTTNLVFESKSNVKLEAIVDNSNYRIRLDMPSHPAKHVQSNQKWIQDIVENTLGSDLNNKQVIEEICLSKKFILIRLKDSNDNNVLKVLPNFDNLVKIDRNGLTNGIIVTQRADFGVEKVHFFSRVFLPFVGVDEDPVCGSAHTVLTPYWIEKLNIGNELVGKQCSQRAGLLYCTQNEDRIQLTGSAIVIFEGILHL